MATGHRPYSETKIRERIAALLGLTIDAVAPLAGGDLSTVLRVRLTDGRTAVAKLGDRSFAEADMLRAIAAAGAPAPAVLAVDDNVLVMEALSHDGRIGPSAWTSLAEALRVLHTSTGDCYGWPTNHAFGAVAILNDCRDDWPDFWADQRIRCHLTHVAAPIARRLEALADRLGDLLPARPPASLLHGDLWGGNVLVSEGRICGLIDPACYHGHREVDVAMLTLFDHPPDNFFAALDLEPGWRGRMPVYQLWPLLVHLRLFGEGYASAIANALDRLGF